MKLHAPFSISSRLLPALKVGDGVIQLERAGNSGGWRIDIPAGEFSEADLKSGAGGEALQQMFATLLDFLSAAAESYGYGLRTGCPGENVDLFPEPVVEWAYQHSDEIQMLRCEIEESGGSPLLIE